MRTTAIMEDLYCESERVTQEKILKNTLVENGQEGIWAQVCGCQMLCSFSKTRVFYVLLCLELAGVLVVFLNYSILVWFWRQYHVSQGSHDHGLWDYRAHSCTQV